MNSSERGSVLGVLLLTAVVPTSLVLLQPFAEPRATLGFLAGWGAALLVMLPGWVLLARSTAAPGAHAFVRAFMTSALLRMLLTVVSAAIFALTVKDAPLLSFVVTFFLGYACLTALELRHVLPRLRGERSA